MAGKEKKGPTRKGTAKKGGSSERGTQIMLWVSGELGEFVRECVDSGLYNNNAELLRDALRRLREDMGAKGKR